MCLGRRGVAADARPLGPGVAPPGRRSPAGGTCAGSRGQWRLRASGCPTPAGLDPAGAVPFAVPLPWPGRGGRAARSRRRGRRAAGPRRHAARSGSAGPAAGLQSLDGPSGPGRARAPVAGTPRPARVTWVAPRPCAAAGSGRAAAARRSPPARGDGGLARGRGLPARPRSLCCAAGWALRLAVPPLERGWGLSAHPGRCAGFSVRSG